MAHHLVRRPLRLWQQLQLRQLVNGNCSYSTSEQLSPGPPSSEQMSRIRQLRERTSAPIKDVKSALLASDWDLDRAHTHLRQRGVVLAAKKSGRTAAEGLLALAQDHASGRAAVIELNCETDFVARNELFQYLAARLAATALRVTAQSEAETLAPHHLHSTAIDLDHPKLSGQTTVQAAVTEVAAMVGENVQFRRGLLLSSSSPHSLLSTYLHNSPHPGLGRIAGLITLEVQDPAASLEPLKALGSSLAMHIVASKPLFLSKELVPAHALHSERQILKTQAEASGKPQMAIEKMVEGRLRKYFEEVVLLEQKFVIDDSKNIKTVLNDLSKEVGSKVNIGNFVRMEIGEGIARLDSSEEN